MANSYPTFPGCQWTAWSTASHGCTSSLKCQIFFLGGGGGCHFMASLHTCQPLFCSFLTSNPNFPYFCSVLLIFHLSQCTATYGKNTKTFRRKTPAKCRARVRHCANKANQSLADTASSSPTVHLFFLTKVVCVSPSSAGCFSQQNRLQTTTKKSKF